MYQKHQKKKTKSKNRCRKLDLKELFTIIAAIIYLITEIIKKL